MWASQGSSVCNEVITADSVASRELFETRGPRRILASRMSVDLPTPIASYIAAENRGDPEALAQCFAENAVVRDEGRTIEGLAAIKQWKAETRKKYQHTVEPLASAQKGGKTIVTNRLTGNFPGSPIELEFVFTLDGDKIASLEILS
ncbi:MAG: nuclear transport factor 2 family protein [Chthoniobacterales bacterium]